MSHVSDLAKLTDLARLLHHTLMCDMSLFLRDLNFMCDMKFICDMTSSRAISICDATYSRAPFVCNMTYSCVTWKPLHRCIHVWHDLFMCEMTHACVTWRLCVVTLSCVTFDSFIFDITPSSAWHEKFKGNPFKQITATITVFVCHSCDVTYSRVTWLIHVWHDQISRVMTRWHQPNYSSIAIFVCLSDDQQHLNPNPGFT